MSYVLLFGRVLATLALICLSCTCGDSASLLAASDAPHAESLLPGSVVLPAPSALESVDDGILDPAGRQASNLDLELLDGAPLIEASGVANWSVGSLNLEPAGELDLAWAIFRASGLDSDGSAIPLSIQLETDKPGWLAISDYSRNRWRIISFSGSGGIPLANGDELVSTAGHCHVAVLAWQDGLDLTSLVLTSNQQPAEPLLNEGEMLGVNMERIGDSARAWSFVDVFKCSRAFTSTTAGGAPDARPLDLDEHGWVKSLQSGQAATAIFLNSQMGNYPAGQFICLYEGSGSILAVGDVSIASQTPGRIVLDYAPTAGGRAALRVTSTDPKDYIRGIHVVFPEYEVDYDSQIFHPDFLSKFSPFKVVRFLNWTRSNNSPLVEWEERGHLDHQTQDSNYGVAPEYICALCNRLQADAWVNIPHLASDDYVASYAQFLRDNLDPGLRVFVEHSNELWGGFAQGDYAEAQGLAAQLSDDPYTARIRWHSQRSVRIFEIFEESFAGSARLVRVMGAAHHDPFTLTEALDWQDAWQHVDVVATAPYIGGRLGAPANAENTKLLDIAGVIQAMDDDSVLSAGKTLANRAICDAHGVGYVAYEGGQALYGQGGYENDPVLAALFIATNRDPGMRQLYFDHHKRWHDNGGGLFMAFTYIGLYSGSGCWGIFETQQQDTQSSFKYLGLLDYDATLP